MAKKSVFKTQLVETSAPSDPEALFRNLHGRGPEVKHLWSQQADLLRAYHRQYRTAQDVAIELPTGAGKTLVGLLIAEWRRQSQGERVAYLCPTRQLASQVGEQANDYGISAHVLIGKQNSYPPQQFGDYQSAQAVAVTTYNGVFNSNPRIDSAQTLILDDAHAGENYIARMWSVEVSRSDDSELYHALLELLRDAFDVGIYSDLADSSEREPQKAALLELVPGALARPHASAIRDLCNERLEDKSSWYAWNAVKDHLEASNIFVSWDSILIRPFIPPTRLHAAFSDANQRIFMSATLGIGGELERITGIKKIEKLPMPTGWDNRGSGRRFFLVPELAISSEDTLEVIGSTAQQCDRNLVLTPSQFDPEGLAVVEALLGRKIRILRANDIEDSIEPFVSSVNTALVLSRYDGLDLPDETCRLVIVAGLPSGTNLQERFLWTRIAATSLLRDRVLTRITQGVGRCTRSDNDYAAVFIVGRRLVEFLLMKENRRILNPELQAEIEFGIRNSREQHPDDFSSLWEAFMERGEQWEEAEEAIVGLREGQTRQDDPVSQQLNRAVSDEIAYLYARWEDDLERALEHARKVADALEGNETRAYRAWWYYLSADTAIALYEATGTNTYQETAEDLLQRASTCCPGVPWFARLRRSLSSIKEAPEANELTAIAVEAIRRQLTDWGTVGSRFERIVADIECGLQSTDHGMFHRGLKGLGEMLGFSSDLPEGNAAPDCVWSLGSAVYVTHEAKSEHTPSNPIGANDIRQAESHRNWVRANRHCEENTKILCLIESPRTSVMNAAIAHSGQLYHLTPEQLQEIYNQSCAVLRRVRSRAMDLSDDQVLEQLLQEIGNNQLTPEKVLERMAKQLVSDMIKREDTKSARELDK